MTKVIVIVVIVVLALVVILALVARRRRQNLVWQSQALDELSVWVLMYISAQPQPFAARNITTLAVHAQRHPQEVEASILQLVQRLYLAVSGVYENAGWSVHLTQAGYDSLAWQAKLMEHLRDHH